VSFPGFPRQNTETRKKNAESGLPSADRRRPLECVLRRKVVPNVQGVVEICQSQVYKSVSANETNINEEEKDGNGESRLRDEQIGSPAKSLGSPGLKKTKGTPREKW